MKNPRGRPRHDDVLTPAEWRTLDAVRHGLGNAEIARRRGISVDAVKYHIGNAVGKLGLENRAALQRWRGIPKGSPLNQENQDMQAQPDITGLGQVSRTVADIEAAVGWYRDVLGLRHLFTFDKLAFFDVAGTRLMLSSMQDVQASESILYFRVPSIAAACSDLEAKGVQFLGAPHMIHKHEDGTEEWMVFFNDSDGRPLALMSATAPAED